MTVRIGILGFGITGEGLPMPSRSAQLAARRAALGLPDVIDVTGQAIPVTGDLCTWIEQVALAAAVPWQVTPVPAGAALGADKVELRIGPPTGGACLKVLFNERGRWTRVRGSGGRHLSSGHWNREGRKGEFADAIDFYVQNARQEWYRFALNQPDPPGWALAKRAATDARARDQHRRSEATRQESIRQKAYTEATRLLRERHAQEFADLLEQQQVIAALEALNARVPST